MNELSCMKLSLPAARANGAPASAPAPTNPAILSTSRRDAERMILAIPDPYPATEVCCGCVPLRLADVMVRQSNKSTLLSPALTVLPQQEFPPDLHQWFVAIG